MLKFLSTMACMILLSGTAHASQQFEYNSDLINAKITFDNDHKVTDWQINTIHPTSSFFQFSSYNKSNSTFSGVFTFNSNYTDITSWEFTSNYQLKYNVYVYPNVPYYYDGDIGSYQGVDRSVHSVKNQFSFEDDLSYTSYDANAVFDVIHAYDSPYDGYHVFLGFNFDHYDGFQSTEGLNGTWRVSSVPETNIVMMMTVGLGMTFLMARKSKQ